MSRRLQLLALAVVLAGGIGCSDSGTAVLEPPVAGRWVAATPTQCGGSPWEAQGQTFDEFLEDLNVDTFDVSIDRFADVACESCACITGERYCVRVVARDVARLLEAGFELDDDRVCESSSR